MRIQGVFTAAKLLALVAVVIAGFVHIAGGENSVLYRSTLYLCLGRVVLGVLVVIVLPITPKVHGFKPGRGRWTVKDDKNPSYFRGEVKPSSLCRKILRHVKDPCGVWQKYFAGKINGCFSPSFFPASLLSVSADICKRALVNESRMIRTQMETHNRSEMPAVHGTLSTIPPHNSNHYAWGDDKCVQHFNCKIQSEGRWRIIFKWIAKRQDMRVWSRFIWLRISPVGCCECSNL
jgi:hypothetical protein